MGGGGSLITFLNNIANLLTGTLGQALAILAICFLGFSMMFGMFDRRHGFMSILGIIVLFSGAWVVAQITGGGAGF